MTRSPRVLTLQTCRRKCGVPRRMSGPKASTTVDERRRVMLVDFDHATLPRLEHKRLSEVSRKRKRQDVLGSYDRKRFLPGRLQLIAINPSVNHNARSTMLIVTEGTSATASI